MSPEKLCPCNTSPQTLKKQASQHIDGKHLYATMRKTGVLDYGCKLPPFIPGQGILCTRQVSEALGIVAARDIRSPSLEQKQKGYV